MMRTLPVLFLVACTGTIDSGDGDDTTPDPTPTNTVAVMVRDGYAPIANVSVIFQGADDSVIATAMTAADGKATAEMPAGGNVTVIREYPTTPPETPIATQIYTYVGVKGGDKLVVAGEMDPKGTPAAINIQVATEAQGTIRVVTPCGSGQGTAPNIPITVIGCMANEVPFYIMDGNNQSFVKRAMVAANVDLSAESYADRLGSTLSATNLPGDLTSVNAEKKALADSYELYTSGTKRVDETAQTITLPDLQGVDELVVASITRTVGGTQVVATRKAYTVGPSVIDASAPRIPATSRVMYAPTGISWVEDMVGTADLVLTSFAVNRPDPTGGPYDVNFVRTIVAPHGTPTLRMPMLPDAKFNPTAGDTLGDGKLAIVQVTGGYDAARARVFAADVTALAPMNGSATISGTVR
jgi:hypothetical protein